MRTCRRSAFPELHAVVRRVFSVYLIFNLAFPSAPAQADVLRWHGQKLFDIAGDLYDAFKSPLTRKQDLETSLRDDLSAAQRAMRVTRLRLCPRRLTLYAGETRTLVPLALNHLNRDEDGEPEVVHGAVIHWETSDSSVATVSPDGEIEAVGAGRARLIARCGTARAVVLVEVLPGVRPIEDDFTHETKHQRDCEDPEAEEVQEIGGAPAQPLTPSAPDADERSEAGIFFSKGISGWQSDLLRTAFYRPEMGSPKVTDAASTSARPAFFQGGLLDGSSSDTFGPQATVYTNTVGSPRLSP